MKASMTTVTALLSENENVYIAQRLRVERSAKSRVNRFEQFSIGFRSAVVVIIIIITICWLLH